ncbi:MAG TPA: FMN-binding protein [Chloroflexota bacterium]|nr:FMN-binding protein [Chloroflexota bacterium]
MSGNGKGNSAPRSGGKSATRRRWKAIGNRKLGTASAPPVKTGGQSSGASGIFKGSAVNDPFGIVQATIVLKNGKISAVNATAPMGNPMSAAINQQAVPLLRMETLQAQSAGVNIVSGATATSQAYIQSLQAALSQVPAATHRTAPVPKNRPSQVGGQAPTRAGVAAKSGTGPGVHAVPGGHASIHLPPGLSDDGSGDDGGQSSSQRLQSGSPSRASVQGQASIHLPPGLSDDGNGSDGGVSDGSRIAPAPATKLSGHRMRHSRHFARNLGEGDGAGNTGRAGQG